MDKKYYYFVVQLPSLQYGDPAPYTPQEFMEQCQTMLSKSDYEALQYCTFDISILDEVPDTDYKFVNTWVARERTMRYTLSQLRSVNLKRGRKEDHINAPHDSPRAEAVANAAFAKRNPLEAELLLDKSRWETIESLLGADLFSINVIFAHILKLSLMQRRVLFKKEEGQIGFDALYASIMQDANKILDTSMGRLS